jgi:predicted DNA-binding protein
MPRQRKESRVLNIRLDMSISDRLEQFCDDSGQTKTAAVERALAAYMDDFYEKQKILTNLRKKD